jgi:hypothetical protein
MKLLILEKSRNFKYVSNLLFMVNTLFINLIILMMVLSISISRGFYLTIKKKLDKIQSRKYMYSLANNHVFFGIWL